MGQGFLPREKFLSLNLDSLVLDKFDAYAKLMIDHNALFNLTAITDPQDIAVKHFADSLCGAALIAQNSKVIDIGSGAGFPGLPLAIVRPDANFTLIDGTGKKVRFLEHVIATLGITNACAIHTRAEEAARGGSLVESFDAATARAVAPLKELVRYAFPLLKPNGKLIAYKGAPEAEIKDAANALKKYHAKIADTKVFVLDQQYDRSLIVVKKLK